MFLSILLDMSISFACGITKLVRGITIGQQDQYNANWNIIVLFELEMIKFASYENF